MTNRSGNRGRSRVSKLSESPNWEVMKPKFGPCDPLQSLFALSLPDAIAWRGAWVFWVMLVSKGPAWWWWLLSHQVVSDSLWPHGLQPTRLLGPWEFPGKSTGVGSHCLLRSVTQSCPTLCDPIDCSMPGFPVHHHLSEFAQIHIHWVSDGIQPSHPQSPPPPPALNLSQHQGLFQWVGSLHKVAKVLEVQLQYQSLFDIFYFFVFLGYILYNFFKSSVSWIISSVVDLFIINFNEGMFKFENFFLILRNF